MRNKTFRQIAALLCVWVLLPGLLPPAAAADGPVKSSNINKQDYSTWSSTVKSYLFPNSSGGLTRVEYINGSIVVEDYDSNFQFLSGRSIPAELSLWGGFYAGKDYNFFVFGQNNPSENDSTEVFRIVKYSKDWQRLGQASLSGANTVAPFEAGSLRCDEYGGYLYIRTCHKMYASSDGLNHQANVMIAVKESDMSVSDAYYDVFNTSYGYVSHSFNQFIIVDQNGRIITLDHGDAYPRGVVWMGYYANASAGKFSGQQYGTWCFNQNLIDFAGQVGDNTTGGSVGGLAQTSDCYLMAFNYDGKGGGGDRMVYFNAADIATGKSKQYKITTSGNSSTPVLAPIDQSGGYMLWNAKNGSQFTDTLNYIAYLADGQPSQVQQAAGSLSDCQPVSFNGKAVWYVTNNSAPVFYTLDADGVKTYSTDTPAPASETTPAAPTIPTTPTAPTTPTTPTTPSNQQFPFADVEPDRWFRPYVEGAYNAGLVNGTTPTAYSPNGSLALSEAVTLAARIYAENHDETVPTGSGSPWYKAAYDYCVSKGVISSKDFPLPSMTAKATRYQMVAILTSAIPAERLTSSVSVSSIPDVPSSNPNYSTVLSWYRAGIIAGDSSGRFNGDSDITRSEVAKILCTIYRIVD